jgi:hypothetical protein
MSRRYRIAHYGTGQIGKLALRQILERSEFELVGHLVHTKSKIGLDTGEIVGCPATGVKAIGDFDEFCGLDADCVVYFATDFGREADEVIEEMCRLLESGKNVVTTTFTRMVYPQSLPAATLTRLENACAAGHSGFFGTGVAPGFTIDALPIHCASVSENPRSVRIYERVLQGTYEDPLSFRALGFGSIPDGPIVDVPADAWLGHFEGAVRMLADGFGWQLSEIRALQDLALAQRDYKFVAGDIPEGTIAAVRLRFDGMVDGEARVQVASVYTMPDDPADSWPPVRPPSSQARRYTRIEIDGNPAVSVQFELEGDQLPGGDATATRAVNAIAPLCNAAPGVHSALDLVIPPRGFQPLT